MLAIIITISIFSLLYYKKKLPRPSSLYETVPPLPPPRASNVELIEIERNAAYTSSVIPKENAAYRTNQDHEYETMDPLPQVTSNELVEAEENATRIISKENAAYGTKQDLEYEIMNPTSQAVSNVETEESASQKENVACGTNQDHEYETIDPLQAASNELVGAEENAASIAACGTNQGLEYDITGPSSQAVGNVKAEESASSITQNENVAYGNNQDPECEIMAPSPQAANNVELVKKENAASSPKEEDVDD